MGRHVVVDHANVMSGFRRATANRPGSPRLRLLDLLALLERDGAASRAFGAFEDESAEPLLAEVQLMGYDTYIVEAPPPGLTVDTIGTLLHGVVANTVLDAPDDEAHVLVLACDDVEDNGYGTSFVTQAERTLAWNWSVEVWSWSHEPIPAYLALRQAGFDVSQKSFAEHMEALVT